MNKLLQNIQGWTQSGPMGNDKQIFHNYLFPEPIENTSVTPDEITEHMEPVQNIITNQMQRLIHNLSNMVKK